MFKPTPIRRFLLAVAFLAFTIAPLMPLAAQDQQETPAPGIAPTLDLAAETPSDLVKGDVTLKLKFTLPEGEKSARGLSVRITAMTISNGKMKVMEWPHENKSEISAKVERASTIVVTAWRDGAKPLRQSEVKFWRAVLPAGAKATQTDIDPVTLDWTIDMVHQPEIKPSDTGQDLSMDFKLDGKQFNTNVITLDPATSKAQLASYKNLTEAKAALSAKKITSALIIRANETENDETPVSQITMYSAGVRSSMCPGTFTLWTTGPDDGLILLRRVSESGKEFASLTQAPSGAFYRRQIMFKKKDIGDFSTVNKAPTVGPTLYGKLAGKYFKLRLGLLELNDTPETTPMSMKARILVQPDNTGNLPGE